MPRAEVIHFMVELERVHMRTLYTYDVRGVALVSSPPLLHLHAGTQACGRGHSLRNIPNMIFKFH